MSLLTKSGSLQVGLGTSNIPITGVGFQPKAVIFYAAKQTASGQSAPLHMCIGFATAATERGCVRVRGSDNVASSSVSNIIRNDACWAIENDGGGINGILDFVSMDSDGFTVVPDDAFSADFRVFYLAVGGDASIEVFAFLSALTTGTGAQSFTGVPFQPDMVLAAWADNANFNISAGAGALGFGCARSSTERGCVSILSENNANPSDTRSIIADDAFMIWPSTSSDAIRIDVDFTAFTSDGFTINKDVTDNSLQKVLFLCLKGVDAKIGTIAANTGTGEGSPVTVGFKPSALILASTNLTTTVQATPAAGVRLSFGAASAPTERGCCWISDPDDTTPTDVQNKNESGRLWIDYGATSPFNVEGEADLSSFGTTSFTLTTADGFPAANLALYLALGPAAAEGLQIDAHDDFLLYPRWGDEQMVAVY